MKVRDSRRTSGHLCHNLITEDELGQNQSVVDADIRKKGSDYEMSLALSKSQL